MTAELHLGVALDGYGWHRQAWRATLARDPAVPSVLSGRYWAELAQLAERGLLDFLTIDDALTPQPGRRAQLSPGRLAGRADAVMVAARAAMATRHIGLIPVATVTHTEPAHISAAIATLDVISHGRAGWQTRVSSSAHESALFGRRDMGVTAHIGVGRRDTVHIGVGRRDTGDLFEEATEFVEVVRRLWSTTPRPPQGQPVVAALAHAPRVYEFASATADLVFVTPHTDDELTSIMAEIDAAGTRRPQVYADAVVTFGGNTDFGSDAVILDAAPAEVADLIIRWHDLGAAGVRLRPAVHATDLPTIVDEVVPLLQKSGRFRTAYTAGQTLRQRLGLPLARNRYEEVPA